MSMFEDVADRDFWGPAKDWQLVPKLSARQARQGLPAGVRHANLVATIDQLLGDIAPRVIDIPTGATIPLLDTGRPGHVAKLTVFRRLLLDSLSRRQRQQMVDSCVTPEEFDDLARKDAATLFPLRPPTHVMVHEHVRVTRETLYARSSGGQQFPHVAAKAAYIGATLRVGRSLSAAPFYLNRGPVGQTEILNASPQCPLFLIREAVCVAPNDYSGGGVHVIDPAAAARSASPQLAAATIQL